MLPSIKQIDDYRWEVPQTDNMLVPGIIYSSNQLVENLFKDDCLKQVSNVAQLPGILKASLAMPDIHSGYGFPIGGVAAFDWNDGIISPGGVGYDINCGVRLMTTGLERVDILPLLPKLADVMFQHIPSGVGSKSKIRGDLTKILAQGSQWAVKNGYGEERDIDHTEDNGCMKDADPDTVSEKALQRGKKQLGTLGSGNHFVEVDVVDTIYDPDTARAFGLFENQVTVLLHTGSRGLGYQICDDYIAKMIKLANQKGMTLPDKQLVYAHLNSPDGKQYYQAMACAANYAWVNRQILTHIIRNIFQDIFQIGPRDLRMDLLYDVCHNIAKKEEHIINNRKQTVCVHRKGATRSLPANHPALPLSYRHIGQPILIPGDMGTASYVLVGTETALQDTFGSTCHGAGRLLSRTAAKKASKGRAIYRELEDLGIRVRCRGRSTLNEEMPDAYKNISDVITVVHEAGISKRVAKLVPLIVVKG